MKERVLELYFWLWLRYHPRTVRRLARDERKFALVKYLIATNEHEQAVFFVKTISQFDDWQVEQLEKAVHAKILRQSPLRNIPLPTKMHLDYPVRSSR